MTLTSFGHDGPQRRLYYEKPDRFALFLFAFPFAFESSLSTLLEMQKASHPPRRRLAFLSSGDRTRTDDLRVMSPTSYQLLHPAISFYCFILFLCQVSTDELLPKLRDSPRNIFLLLYFISLSGFNRRATPETSGLTPQYLYIALF